MLHRVAASQPKGIALLDGALGTELTSRGFDLKNELWSAVVLGTEEGDRAVQDVHEAYYRAGALICTTASYQAGDLAAFVRVLGLTEEESRRRVARSVQLCRRARDTVRPREGLVAASCGSYGASLPGGQEFHGNFGMSEAELEAFHMPRLAIVLAEGPDLIAFETLPEKTEAVAVCNAMRRHFPSMPYWVSFSAKSETEVSSGETFAECVAAVLASAVHPPEAIGINCTQPRYVSSLLRIGREAISQSPHPGTLLLCYPNAGAVWDGESQNWTGNGSSPEQWCQYTEEWVMCGAKILGGCCNTTPAHISLLKKVWL